jgi:hypothetical protein
MRHDGPVVIALDGSPHSTQTLHRGLDEAEHRAAEAAVVRQASARSVVVGVDGSPTSLAAAAAAAREATWRSAPLVVLHARPPLRAPNVTFVVPPLGTADADDLVVVGSRGMGPPARDQRPCRPGLRPWQRGGHAPGRASRRGGPDTAGDAHAERTARWTSTRSG